MKPRGCVAPFALLRVAALPYEDLVAMAPRRTLGHLEDMRAAEDRGAAVKEALVGELHAAVPSCTDKRARAAMIALKRAVHNDRGGDASVILDGAISPGLRALLAAHVEADAERSAAFELASRAFEEEVPTWVRSRLSATAGEERFRCALAIASPQLLARTADLEPGSALRSSKLERAVLAYWMRSASKTSPFSVFMHQAFVPLEGREAQPAETIDGGSRCSRSYVSPSIFVSLGEALAASSPEAGSFEWNPTLRWLDRDRAEALTSRRVTYGTRLWRSERRAVFRLHESLREAHARLASPFGRGDLERSLREAGLSPKSASRFVERAIEGDVVRRVASATAFGEHPPATIRSRVPGPTLDALIATVESVACGNASQRSARVAEARASVAQLWREVGGVAPSSDLAIVLEDAFFAEPLTDASAPVRALLEETATALSNHVYVRRSYDYLHEAFLERFGPGGRCTDVPRFLGEVSERALVAGRSAFERSRKRYEGSGAASRATTTAFVQIAARDAASLASGDALAVVGQLASGCGWLAARHALGDSTMHAALRAALRAWLIQAKAPLEPVDLSISGDCNPLQIHPQLTERVLAWPTEPIAPGVPIVRAAETTLLHDVESSLLRLYDAGGKPIAPVYLGGTIPFPTWGPVYWMTLIGEPLEVDLGASRVEASIASSDVIHRKPRWTAGRVVLARATWKVPAELLRKTWLSETGAKRLARVIHARDQCEMPRFVFARPILAEAGLGNDHHKPLWIDTLNPFCLDMLASLAEDAAAVVFTEALPDPSTTWQRIDGRRHVTEYLVEMGA